MSAVLLVQALRDPSSVEALDGEGWNTLIAAARAEQLIGSLAWRLDGSAIPPAAAQVLADARASAEHGRTLALWEAEMARRALVRLAVPVVLLKGTAYVAAGLAAGRGRAIGDLDILVPRDAIDRVERALLDGGWEWVKPDPYDDAYYRRWMHELPPLIHRERDRMIDVHHTILPLTARPDPDAGQLIAGATALNRDLSVLSREDMVVHAAAHLFADGDLQGGLRNLWDIDRLFREFGDGDPGYLPALLDRAAHHGLIDAVRRSLRVAHHLYGTPGVGADGVLRTGDRPFVHRLLARDGWGRIDRKVTEFGFYVRSHFLRMPPAMLAGHLWTKWRGGHRG